MHKDGLEVLREMKTNPSELVAHARDQSHFLRNEILAERGG